MRKLVRCPARRYPVSLAASVLLFIPAIPGIAATDTLRTYEPGGHYGVYTDGSLVKCVQRMRLPAGTRMTSVSVMLDGPQGDHACDIVVYGHEGGLLAPRLERAVVRTRVTKEKDGIETVTTHFDDPYVHAGGQCFVSVEGRHNDVRLVTDMIERVAPCTEASGQRRLEQLVQASGGAWSTAPFGFMMDVVVEMPEITERGFVRDTMLDDARDKGRSDVRYLSVSDVNGDGRLDFSAAGMLYMNDGRSMTPVDITLEDTSATPYVFFVDADGDGRMDVAAMNGAGDDKVTFYTMKHGGHLVHMGQAQLSASLVPMSMSIGDIDHDGKEEILLGGRSAGVPTLFALGRATSGVWQASPWAQDLLGTTEAPVTMIADVDKDGRLDVVLRTGAEDHIVRMVGEGQSWSTEARGRAGESTLREPIGSWIGWDDERQAAILRLPSSVPWSDANAGTAHDVRMVSYGSASIALDDGDAESPRYEEHLSSVIYADLDNDGVQEQLRFSRGTCRYLGVFQKTSGTWEDVTSAWGLDGLDDCGDGVVCDLDGDGRLDLLVDRRNSVQVYYNRMNIMPGRTARLAAAPQPLAGASVDVGTTHMTYASGRGRLVQDPPVFTLPPTGNTADTMTVYWPGDGALKERVLVQAGGHDIHVRRGSTGTLASYDEAVQIRMSGASLTISSQGTLERANITLLNLVGETVLASALGNLPAGIHTLTISELDKTKTLVSGTYVVRLQWETGDAVSVLRIIR